MQLLRAGSAGLCCLPAPGAPPRALLPRPQPRPPGSQSPIQFDSYSLRHAAFVGLHEVAWTAEFEKELTRRKVSNNIFPYFPSVQLCFKVFVNKGSSAFNHFAFFKSKPAARRLADDAMAAVAGSQVEFILCNTQC